LPDSLENPTFGANSDFQAARTFLKDLSIMNSLKTQPLSMKALLKSKITVSCISLIAGMAMAHADAVSTPVGFIKLTFPASSTSTLSLPLQHNAVAVGPISGVGATTLSDSKSTWTSGQFAVTGKPYFVKMLTGKAAGRYFLITGNTGTQLTVDTGGTSLVGVVAVGNRYQICAGKTLGSLFGTSSVSFLKNADYTLADNVTLWSGSKWETYYHNGTSWRRKGYSTVQNNVVLYPDEGISIIRRGTTPLTMVFLGEVSMVSEQTKFVGPASTYAANRYPVDVTLGSLGFLSLPNWKSSSDSSYADIVYIRQGTKWVSHWHNGSFWRKGSSTASQNNAIIPTGSGYQVIRKSSSAGVDPFATQTKPY
jgi:uncharacterized protein (TIGR02597 family)